MRTLLCGNGVIVLSVITRNGCYLYGELFMANEISPSRAPDWQGGRVVRCMNSDSGWN